MNAQIIHAKIDELSWTLQQEVLDYIEYLLQKYPQTGKQETFCFDWEGGLADLREQFTSVELQHKVSEWR
jgi:hypothetical protein